MTLAFEHTELQKDRFKEWIQAEPSFRRVFTRNITDKFNDELRHRIEGKRPDHVILMLYGETGTFKSSVAQEIARNQLDKHFNLDKIVFRNREIIDTIPTLTKKSCLIRDENPIEMGMGTGRIASEIDTYVETLRKAQISLIFIRPQRELLRTAHFYLRTIDVTLNGSAVRVGVQDPSSLRYLGGILVPIEQNNALWQAYEGKKDAFIEGVMKNDGKGLPIDRLADKVIALPQYSSDLKIKELRLLVYKTFKGYTTSEVDMILTEVRMRQKTN
jgi:hypothetical protein